MKDEILKSNYSGDLQLGEFKISCAVLEDGSRVLVSRSLATAFGIKGSGSYWQKKRNKKGELLPEYLSATYLKPFISQELHEKLSRPIPYINKSGVLTEGVSAEILADICDIYIKANERGAMPENQHIAENAYKLLVAFSKVGIIALIDEATGYQYDREKDELQKILKAYISEELLPWQKRFPDLYYRELFRLNGWEFTLHGIKKRPGVIGRWTNTLIYERLPKGVLEELKKKTPKSQSGKYSARFHQSLTIDIGEPNLTAQLNKIITVFQLSDSMEEVWSQFTKLKNREEGQFELPFTFDDLGHTKEPIYEDNKLSNFNKVLKQALEKN